MSVRPSVMQSVAPLGAERVGPSGLPSAVPSAAKSVVVLAEVSVEAWVQMSVLQLDGEWAVASAAPSVDGSAVGLGVPWEVGSVPLSGTGWDRRGSVR